MTLAKSPERPVTLASKPQGDVTLAKGPQREVTLAKQPTGPVTLAKRPPGEVTLSKGPPGATENLPPGTKLAQTVNTSQSFEQRWMKFGGVTIGEKSQANLERLESAALRNENIGHVAWQIDQEAAARRGEPTHYPGAVEPAQARQAPQQRPRQQPQRQVAPPPKNLRPYGAPPRQGIEIPMPNDFCAAHGYNPFPPRWERWLLAVRNSILSSQPVAGRNTTVDVHPGKGTVVNVTRERGAAPDCGGCVCIDTVTITAAGTGYIVGRYLAPLSGTACNPDLQPFQLQIATVDGSGGVTSVNIIPGPLPCPDSISIEFTGVTFDCGCKDTGSGTSAIFTEGTFNGSPVAFRKLGGCGNACFWGFDSMGGICEAGTFENDFSEWESNTSCSGSPDETGTWDQCVVNFFSKDGLYYLIITSTFLGFRGYPVFYGTTTDISLPIANTIDCGTGIAHGGTATIT